MPADLGIDDPAETLGVSVYLKVPDEPVYPPGSAADLADLLRPMTQQTLTEQRQAEYAEAASLFSAYATGQGLGLAIDLARRRIDLTGSADQLAALLAWEARDQAAVPFPADLARWTAAVLDWRGPNPAQASEAHADAGLWATEVAALYGIRAEDDGEGACAGIIALGGAYLPSDLGLAMASMGRPLPHVIEQSVIGPRDNPGDQPTLDRELALDLQVLAGIVRAARIVIYFTDNTQRGLARAIHAAVFDTVNRPSVLSISWGSAEKYWSESARYAVQAALADAIRLRVTVVAAAGDLLASAGETDGAAHVQFPGSSPYVLCCGGTRITVNNGTADGRTETVWHDDATGTGGGISDLFPVPAYQAPVALPPSVNDGARRRGMPDVAAAASQNPGYRTIVHGVETAQSGTSAATPLWAALITAANAQRGQPVGLIQPLLYANPGLFHAVTEGDNRDGGVGYAAGPGWNACTGLGTPRGAAVIAALIAIA